jgi:hypothetical protein
MRPESEFNPEDLVDAFLLEPAAPEPSGEHVEQLRQRLLAEACSTAVERNLLTPVGSDISEKATNRRIWSTHRGVVTIAGVAITITLWLVVTWTGAAPETPIMKFRQVLATTGTQAWVHGQTIITASGATGAGAADSGAASSGVASYGARHQFETWFSPAERLAALRTETELQVTDYNLGVQFTYDRGADVFRQSAADPHHEHFGRTMVVALLSGGDLTDALPFHSVSEVQKTSIRLGEGHGIQYQFSVTWRSNPALGWLTTVIVDAENRFIQTWEEQHSHGLHVYTKFDYPTDGPRDLAALGAPPTPPHLTHSAEPLN